MQVTLQNTSKAPQGIHDATGKLVFVQPGAKRSVDLDEARLQRVRSLPFFTVAAEKAGALDHDGDGKKGGSVDELDQMKVADLKALAEAEGVDLQDATKKDDIIAAIRLDREAKAEAAE